jgi:hypothetical protein
VSLGPEESGTSPERDGAATAPGVYPGVMESDPGALSRWFAQTRLQARDSQTRMAGVRREAQAQARYARAVRVRAEEQSARHVNEWPALRGLAALGEARTPEEVLTLVLDAARVVLGGCDSIGLTVVDQFGSPDEPPYRTATATGLAECLDAAQYRLREGPCVEAVELDMVAVVNADDLTAPDERQSWPQLCRVAEDLGVRSAVSVAVPWSPWRVGVHPERRSLGAINAYAREPDAFGQRERSAIMLGCWAGAVMSSLQPADILRAGV